MKKICKGCKYCEAVMSMEQNFIWKHNHGQKLIKVLLLMIHDASEVILEKTKTFNNNANHQVQQK